MVISILRLAAVCVSTYGYILFFGERITPALSIGFTFACIGSAMFFAGLLNVLPEAALIVCLSGLLCLGLSLKKGIKPSLDLGGAFFLVMLSALTFRVWGRQFIQLDNFTHWGLVVRHMLAKNRFPNFSDSYIRFQSYPVGSGSLIYYFAMLSGIHAEWFQMLVHWACSASMFCGLLCLADNIPAKVTAFIVAPLLLCADNSFDQLLVDGTLGFVALGAAIFCAYHAKDLRQKGLYVIPWLTYLVSVKNSGALFALFIVALVLIWGGWRKGLAGAAAPAATLLLWNRHVAYGFEQGMMAQHSMSIDNFRRMLDAKRAGSVETILSGMVREVFSPANPYLLVFLISLAALGLAAVWLKEERRVRVLLIYGIACYLIYQAGMACMYVFTMSEKEAVRLASYPRYHATILIFSSGVMTMALILMSNRVKALKNGRVWTVACCAACVASIVVSGIPRYYVNESQMNDYTGNLLPVREKADDILRQGELNPEARYYILVDDDFTTVETMFLYNMVNCRMLARDVQVRKLDKLFNPEEVKQYDYLVRYGESDALRDFIRENYGSQARIVRTAPEEKPDADQSTQAPASRGSQARGRGR